MSFLDSLISGSAKSKGLLSRSTKHRSNTIPTRSSGRRLRPTQRRAAVAAYDLARTVLIADKYLGRAGWLSCMLLHAFGGSRPESVEVRRVNAEFARSTGLNALIK